MSVATGGRELKVTAFSRFLLASELLYTTQAGQTPLADTSLTGQVSLKSNGYQNKNENSALPKSLKDFRKESNIQV